MQFVRGSSLSGLGDLIAALSVAGGAGFIGAHLGAQKSEKILREKVDENIGATCHSLAELAAMGHPYSVVNPNNPHPDQPWLVHKQTGRLLRSVKSGTREGAMFGEVEVFAQVDESTAPYARFIIEGTSQMQSRDFLSASREQAKDAMSEAMQGGIGKVLLGAALFYQIARYSKWASKFTGSSPVVSRMYKSARMARNAEVLAQGQPYGLSRRFLNVTMAGPVASRFMVPGGGGAAAGGAVVNKFIAAEYGKRAFKAF